MSPTLTLASRVACMRCTRGCLDSSSGVDLSPLVEALVRDRDLLAIDIPKQGSPELGQSVPPPMPIPSGWWRYRFASRGRHPRKRRAPHPQRSYGWHRGGPLLPLDRGRVSCGLLPVAIWPCRDNRRHRPRRGRRLDRDFGQRQRGCRDGARWRSSDHQSSR